MTGPGSDDHPDDADADESPGDDGMDEWEWADDTSTSADDESAAPDDESEPADSGSGTGDDDEAGDRGSPGDDSEPASHDRESTEPAEGHPLDTDADSDTGATAPAPQPGASASDGDEDFDGPIDWFFNTSDPWVQTIRDIGSSVLTVAIIGLVLFAVSGVWPPLVAVESGSMEPHMHKNDLVFIVDEHRYAPASAAEGTGVVTYQHAKTNGGYWSFGDYGNVIVYQPYGSDRRTPIIHRAMFYVEEGENWYQRANKSYLDGANSCAEIANDACPAPHSGFITKGDNEVTNDHYDQVGGQSNVVRPEWIQGKAKVRIPFLGWVRLQFAQLATVTAGSAPPTLTGLRLQLGLFAAGLGTVVSRRRGWL
ncbi:S26 family signal peptidase [Haloarchaeobius amylolyticus]|uniref:S26 family signal peptidase n=1 Tax=Haloarchaeobius amylolyticus TaxID=1198296 RepID=UPI00226DF941|nr:S26 family signal peptidase [Haloarchaeobius amylolyticus]